MFHSYLTPELLALELLIQKSFTWFLVKAAALPTVMSVLWSKSTSDVVNSEDKTSASADVIEADSSDRCANVASASDGDTPTQFPVCDSVKEAKNEIES